jgi:RNA polymerase sigma-70 factor (ECF subfamily)
MDELLQRHLPGLLAYIRLHTGALVRSKEESVDLCQSVCREVLEDVDGFEYRGEGQFRSWLYTRALAKIRDRERHWFAAKRDAGREATHNASDARMDLAAVQPSFTSPSQVAIREEDMQELERAFAQLPEDYRRVITLARIVGLSHAEIAQEIGRTEAATRVLLHRALVRLGILLSDREIVGDGST